MQEQVDFVRLREFMAKHHKFTAPVPDSDDLESMLIQYRKYMEQHGFAERAINIYLKKARFAFDVCDDIFQTSPEYSLIRKLMYEYEQASMPRDKRNQNYVVYPVDVVLIVVMLAKLCGYNNCKQYAEFWFSANPYLQCLVPCMPAPCYMISRETIATCLKLVPDEGYEKIFEEMFADVKIKLKDLLLNDDPNPENKSYRPTIGGDGQELKASYRKGETSRHKKGSHAVVVFNCDDRVALGYTAVKLKNHEVDGFMHILNKIEVPRDGIFYADAINTRKNLIDFLNARKLDWLFAIKEQKATKLMYETVNELLEAETDSKFRKVLAPKITAGRIEERTLEAVAIPEGITQNNFSAKSAIKVTKHTLFKTNGAKTPKQDTTVTRYYISSLECNEENFEQIAHSISVRWYYEQHHNTIDEVLLQDRQAVCDEEHLAAIIGLNKFAYNVLSFARQKLSKEGYSRIKHRSSKFRPMSYEETISTLDDDPSLAFTILLRYLTNPNADAD